MGTVNYSVPDDVKDAFNATFANHNRSAIVAELLRAATHAAQRERKEREAAKQLLESFSRAPVLSDAQIRAAIDAGRK